MDVVGETVTIFVVVAGSHLKASIYYRHIIGNNVSGITIVKETSCHN
jgi:hypothetical protein